MRGGADNNDALSASCGVPNGATTIEDPQPYSFSYFERHQRVDRARELQRLEEEPRRQRLGPPAGDG